MDALLEELCVGYGWCLEPNDYHASEVEVVDRETVIDAILHAEYGDSRAADRATRRWLAALADDWLFDPRGRGASSGLPL